MTNENLKYLGPIKNGRTWSRIKYITSVPVQTGAGEEALDYFDDSIRYIRISDFDSNGKIDEDKAAYIDRKIGLKFLIKKNDILAATAGATVGKTLLYEGLKEDACYAGYLAKIRTDSYKMDSRFLFYQMISKLMEDFRECAIKKSTIENISASSYSNMYIHVTDIENQKRIADYLDKKVSAIDLLIEKEKKVVEELESYKINLITNEVFGSVATGKNKKHKWLTVELPDGYKIEKLKFYVSFGKGLSITKDDLIEEGIPVISYGQIHAKFNTGTTMKEGMLRFVDEKYLKSGRKALLNVGDFIFADTSEDKKGTGNFALNDIDGSIFAGYHTIVARPKKDFVSKYFAYQFLTDVWRNQVRSLCDGTRSYSITQKILSETFIINPPKSVQENVVKCLDKKCEAIDKLLALKEEKIEKLKEYKKSLIYECVTGRRDINA